MGVSSDISFKMHAIVSVLSVFLLFNFGLAWEETSSAEYIAKTAAEKNAIINANVIEDTTPGDWYGILEMGGIFTESMCPTLRAPGDELPWEEGIISDGTRYKYIHTVGAVGQVEWRDLGGHSANLVAMYSVNGQDSWNFFK